MHLTKDEFFDNDALRRAAAELRERADFYRERAPVSVTDSDEDNFSKQCCEYIAKQYDHVASFLDAERERRYSPDTYEVPPCSD